MIEGGGVISTEHRLVQVTTGTTGRVTMKVAQSEMKYLSRKRVIVKPTYILTVAAGGHRRHFSFPAYGTGGSQQS